MSAHTPGPWLALPGGIYAELPDGSRVKVATIEQLNGIAPHWEPAANASLLAAAPDLLPALQQAKALIRTWHGMGLPEVDEGAAWEIYASSSPEMQRLNAAIAKATGEAATS